jgi:hypothetical protein
MSHKGQTATVAVAFVLGAQALWADVTPQQVWQSWQDNARTQGHSLTAASVEVAGDTLIVTGINARIPGDRGETSFLIREIAFKDNGDGTVAIRVPDSFPVLITTPPDTVTSAPEEYALSITMPGAKMTASGTPGSLSYRTALPTLEASTDIPDIRGDGTANLTVVVSMTGVSGDYVVEAAEVGSSLIHDYRVKTADVKLTASGSPETVGSLTLSLTDLGGGLAMTGIPADGGEDFELAFKDGMTMDMKASYGIGSFDLAGQEQGAPLKMTGTFGGGSFVASFAASLFRYAGSGKSVAFNASGTDASTGAPFSLSSTLANFSSRAEFSGAYWMDDFDAAIAQGLQVSAALGLGPTSLDFAGGGASDKTSLTASLGGVDTSFALNTAAMDYDLGARALRLTVAAPDLPVPQASMDLTELVLDFAIPLAKSSEPAPFHGLAKVVNLSMAEALWGIFDPSGMLPRAPATLILDANGTALVARDLLADPMSGVNTSPGILTSLELAQVLLQIAGFEVTAQGGLTFDQTDMTTFPGMPLPTGKIKITALGLNGLTDTLVKLGLLTQDQAMQGRMMLSMFANSSAETDEITSTLEFKDKGFFANGARLQ